jgi:hypothetical protein
MIMSDCGIASRSPSLEPGADPFAERIAKRIYAHRSALSPNQVNAAQTEKDALYQAWLGIGADLKGLNWDEFMTRYDTAMSSQSPSAYSDNDNCSHINSITKLNEAGEPIEFCPECKASWTEPTA